MPILREFDLHTDMGDLFKDREFNNQIRCIAALYERLFRKYKFKNEVCWKILIECTNDLSEQNKKLVKSNVYEVYTHFDVKHFFTLSDCEKKKLILETLQEGVRLVIEEENWDSYIFEEVYEEIIKLDYQNNYIYDRPKASPTRKYKAEIFCEHTVHSFDISIIIRDKTGLELKREKIKSEVPDEWEFVKHLGQLRWISHEEVAIINKTGKPKWIVQL